MRRGPGVVAKRTGPQKWRLSDIVGDTRWRAEVTVTLNHEVSGSRDHRMDSRSVVDSEVSSQRRETRYKLTARRAVRDFGRTKLRRRSETKVMEKEHCEMVTGSTQN